MTTVRHLLADRDFEAYADGALAGDRLEAAEAALLRDPLRRERVASLMLANDALRAAREALYAEKALREKIERLIKARRMRQRVSA